MEKDKRLDIVEAREYKVVKGNEIIQRARYDLSLSEMKIFSFIISKVKPRDKAFREYEFSMTEYLQVIGAESNGGKNYNNVKRALKQLSDKSFYLMQEDGSERIIRWLYKAELNRATGKVKVILDHDLQKFICGLFENFTQYELICTLPMQSAYSIRMYELLKSYAFTKKHMFDLDDLKRMLGCEHYTRFPDFRRKVLEVVTREINEYTDIEVSWEPLTSGPRRVIGVQFYIKSRDVWEQVGPRKRARAKLDGQLSMFNDDGGTT